MNVNKKANAAVTPGAPGMTLMEIPGTNGLPVAAGSIDPIFPAPCVGRSKSGPCTPGRYFGASP